jgi:hypothetical protein
VAPVGTPRAIVMKLKGNQARFAVARNWRAAGGRSEAGNTTPDEFGAKSARNREMGDGGERVRIKARLSAAARALRVDAFMREFIRRMWIVVDTTYHHTNGVAPAYAAI